MKNRHALAKFSHGKFSTLGAVAAALTHTHTHTHNELIESKYIYDRLKLAMRVIARRPNSRPWFGWAAVRAVSSWHAAAVAENVSQYYLRAQPDAAHLQ